MRARRKTICAAPAAFLLLLSFFLAAPVAGSQPSFEEIIRSKDAHMITAWGQRYQGGIGVPQDHEKAAQLYCKAARKGDAEAKFRLAQMYAFGQGVPKSRELAAAWVYQAAQAKVRGAESLLQVLRVEGKPERAAACVVGKGTRLATRAHPARGEVAKLVRTLAPRYALDPNLVLAVVEAESGFNPKARSPKNAQGLMQLIPATAQRFGVEDVWDPEQNLRGGMAYLRWLLDHFNGDVKLALAGYNAGENAVKRHGGIPPYAETQAYVDKIIRRIGGEAALRSG